VKFYSILLHIYEDWCSIKLQVLIQGGMSKLILMWVHLLLQNYINVISQDYILPPSYIFLSMGSSYFNITSLFRSIHIVVFMSIV